MGWGGGGLGEGREEYFIFLIWPQEGAPKNGCFLEIRVKPMETDKEDLIYKIYSDKPQQLLSSMPRTVARPFKPVHSVLLGSKLHCPVKYRSFDLGHWYILGAIPTMYKVNFGTTR